PAAPATRTDAYGDPLPPWARLRLGSVRLRHGHYVLAVAFAPDGQTVASGSRDGTIRFWDAATGKERFALLGHKDGVNCIAFAPDGKTLASGGGDSTLRLWDLATRKERFALPGHGSDVWCAAFAP